MSTRTRVLYLVVLIQFVFVLFLSLAVVLLVCEKTIRGAEKYVNYSDISESEYHFGESLFECTGTCYCDDEFRRGAIARNSRYFIYAVSSFVAFKAAQKHVESGCKVEFEDECRDSMIRYEVEDCVSVQSEIKEETKKLLEDDIDDSVTEFKKTVKSIGVVRSPVKRPEDIPVGQHSGWGTYEGIIEVFPQYVRALREIDGFDYIFMFFMFHKNLDDDNYPLVVHPWRDKSLPLIGLLASRSPFRPNCIGMTKLKLLKVEDNLLYVDGLDVIHGTPVIDIKPYVTKNPDVRTGWMRPITDKLESEGKDYSTLTTDDEE